TSSLPYLCRGRHPALPSFPTRRSSDLPRQLLVGQRRSDPRRHPVRRRLELSLQGRRCEPAIELGAGAAKPLVDQRRLPSPFAARSEEHTSELQSRENLVCRLLLEKKKE